jgi:S1-C subfamily serine protease
VISAAQVYQNSIQSVVSISINDNGNVYIGSGFFCQIDSSGFASASYGYIVTAGHVITDPSTNEVSSEIWIHLQYPTISSFRLNGVNAVVMGIDKLADVALIRVQSSQFSALHLPIKDSRTQVAIGDSITVIGYPQGDDLQSVTRGVVRDNKYQNEYVPESVLTDASTYGGNSGGPVLADSGHVIGILSWGDSTQENLNGAVSSYLFRPILKYFCDHYSDSVLSFPKGYLGIFYTNVNFYHAMIYGVQIRGVRVIRLDQSIVPSTFNLFDIITEVEGIRVGTSNQLFPLFTEIHLRAPGSSVNMKYIPYNNATGQYDATELSKQVVLMEFNGANDVFINNVHRKPYNPNQLNASQ